LQIAAGQNDTRTTDLQPDTTILRTFQAQQVTPKKPAPTPTTDEMLRAGIVLTSYLYCYS